MKNHQAGNISKGSIQEFHASVADHGTFLGGGAVAAVTAAGAAALTSLVFGLTARRKANTDVRDDLLQAIDEVGSLEAAFHSAADEDASALGNLLDAQRAMKSTNDRAAYQNALLDAAKAPLGNAQNCIRLLQLIEQYMQRATTFTVSDLGAAASLAHGALQASALMCEVNLSLLRNEPDLSDPEAVARITDDVRRVVDGGSRLAGAIEAFTSKAIR